MKKFLKVFLKILLVIVALVIIVAIVGIIYINKSFLNIDKKDKFSKVEIKELTVDGFTFKDLNRNGALDIYEDSRQPVEARVNDVLSQMTLEEKIRLVKGSGMGSGMGYGPKGGIPGAVGTIVPIPRLGLPTIYLSDGPAGLRLSTFSKENKTPHYCTAFPIGSLLASTWNTELVQQVGIAMGNETKEYGIDVILGPGANIHRNPLCGRNFEYYSEDPVVTGEIGAAMVNGIESNGVGTSVKHFVANNQETNRNNNNAIISDRAMREIYLKGFEIIVRKAQPWTIMSSYNLINGTHVSASKDILTDILRDDWGFEGLVMTDWYGGTNPPVELAAGNDLFEPGTRNQYKTLLKAAENGELSEADIDVAVKRILHLIMTSQKMKGYNYSNNPDLKAHATVTRNSATEGMVLLKNEAALPLTNVKNVALFGVFSYDFIAGGTGSGDVNEAYTISLEEGLANAGYQVNQAAKDDFEAHKAANAKAFKKPQGTLQAMMVAYTPPEFVPTEEQLKPIVNEADIAIITIGRNSGEGKDRVKTNDFDLSDDEQKLIEEVCADFHAAGKKVIVVLNIGGVIETASWKEKPDAILLAWQGGQEGGNSVADILSGKVNPSGKLPMTFPISLEDHASSANFPMEGTPMNTSSMMASKEPKPEAEQVKDVDYTRYEEGIYVGYRHFDKNNIEVSYPFGFGLSYTTFEYENMNVEVVDGMINVSVTVKNTGEVAGKEVVEIYVAKPESSIDRPAQELKTFAKTPLLNPGESAGLTMTVPVSDLSYWNEATSSWTLEPGTYKICAGASSRDKRLSKEVSL